MSDEVNHPQHYNAHPSGVECIDIVEHFNFNVGNAVKYLWRAGIKDEDTLLTDLEKAEWYVRREIERLKRERQLQLDALLAKDATYIDQFETKT